MVAITFELKMGENGTLTIPVEAVEQLGIHPGDEVRVRVEAAEPRRRALEQEQESLQAKIDDFFAGMSHDTFQKPSKLPSGDEAEDAFVAAMDEKYRRLGFKP